MLDISLYKYDENSVVFIRDKNTSKSASNLTDANNLLQQMLTVGTEGYNGCAIYDRKIEKFLKKAFIDPFFKKDFNFDV